eukprot:g8317.t1
MVCTSTGGREVVVTGDSRRRKFDHVFGADSTQEQVYRSTTLPLVNRCLEGYNATVLAYGQTGSGKTFTVGNAYTVNAPPEDAGIIPRAVTDLFERINKLRKEGVKASVHASFLEVINEDIKDLIGSEGAAATGLPLRENTHGEVTVAGLSKHEINSAENLQALLERGALCRTTASTNMNAHSSRSHAICTLSFEMVCPATEDTEETVTSSQFHLVDLAGSERAKKTGAEGKRMREGININKGLLALGNVISALAEGGGGSGGGHVPYRDSKLTRLLQGSLGGNSHTLMIACISPADSNMGESVNTMRYAERAMNIQNTAVKNEDVSGPPVSYAEVMALRKQVRVMEVELVQSRLSGLAGGFGFDGAGARGMGMAMGGGGASAKAYRDALEETAELRRRRSELERRVLEETRHATVAVEGEMSARVESDTWRLRCEQLLAVLKEADPSALAGLPLWATKGEKEEEDEHEKGEARSPDSSEDGSSAIDAGLGAPGSLARELRRKVFALEQTVFSLEGKLRLADEARLERGGGGGEEDGTPSTVLAAYDGEGQASSVGKGSPAGSSMGDCSFESFDCGSDVGAGEGDGREGSGPGGDGGAEEIRRVDAEIESKELELQMKARQAQAYEAMKGQFEGLLGRLQGEVTSLQSERDGLLQKLSGASSTSTSSRTGGAGGSGGSSAAAAAATAAAGGGAALARMKARVVELEARIKENRKKVAEHQRAERARVAAAKEAERLRAEVAEAKQRRAELQRTHREASTRFMKETRQLHLKDARMQRDGERMQWQVKKLQESQERTQAALKRKMEEHAIAMRKVRTLQTQRQGGRGGVGDGAGSGAGGRGDKRHPSVKEARKAEMEAWLATEIEEDTAVQRAKRALKAQLKLRGEAACRAQAIREAINEAGDVAAAEAEAGEAKAGNDGDDMARNAELQELEERVATASKAIKSLQTFLVSTDRKNAAPASRLAAGVSTADGGGAGSARWARVRTAWDSKTALSLLFSEAVKFKVLGMDFAEASSLKDMEVRRLMRENSSLRSAAAAAASDGVGRAAALEAAVAAAEAQVEAAVGGAYADDDGDGTRQHSAADHSCAKEKQTEDEEDGGAYEQGERSFIVVSDTEEDEEEDDDDDDDDDYDDDDDDNDDDDEEWLPDALLASKKRSSSNSSAASGNGGEGGVRGRYDDPDGTAGSSGGSSRGRGKGGTRTSGGGGGKSDRSSSGSVVSVGSAKSVWSVYSDGEQGDWTAIEWDNLNSYTVAQLKEFLRHRLLPVSGKKEILVNRLLQAARDVGHLPQVPPSPAPTSPSGSDVSFSLPGRGTPAAATAAASVGGDRSSRTGEEGLSREVRDADPAATTAGGDKIASGRGVEGEGGGRRPAAAATAAGQQQMSLKERLEARVQERDLAARRETEASSSPGSRSSGSSSSRVNSGAGPHQAKHGATGSRVDRRGMTSASQGKSSVVRSSSQQRTIEAGMAAVAAVAAAAASTTMGPPAARKPLGTLRTGNLRNGSANGRSGNERAGGTKAAVKTRPSTGKVQMGSTKQPTGGVAGGCSTAQPKNLGQAGVPRSSATGALQTPAGAGSSTPVQMVHKATAGPSGSSRPGKVGRVSPSSGVGDLGRSKDARAAFGGPKRQVAAATTAPDQRKRARVDSANGVSKTGTAGKAKGPSFARPTTSSAGAPSFMKPTKNFGSSHPRLGGVNQGVGW